MIDFSLSSEHRFLLKMTIEFANTELAFGIAYRDHHSQFPKQQVKNGWIGLDRDDVSKKMGGLGF